MRTTNAYDQYMELSGITATPGELLIMLLDAEIKNIKIAILQMNNKNITEAHNRIIKAQDIIDELLLSLDYKYEISEGLAGIYTYIKGELVAANIKKDQTKLQNLLPIITELRDTWKKANSLSRTT